MDGFKNCPFCDERIKENAIKCKHCGSVLSGDMATGVNFQNPDTLVQKALEGNYEIKGTIGKGGMAVVYKAIQKSLDRPVALKIVHQNLVHDQEFLNRFIREAKVSASLNHHNIVTVHDVASVGSVHYMAMEYLQGIPLSNYLRKHKSLSATETIQLMLPIADALEYIRNRNLVHRDIKSSNIIITEGEGRPVLTDFGIVYVSGEAGLSQAGAIVGTPEYMSPEQAEGKVQLDHRSDIYSLGVIIYECLTGKVPFHSESPLGTIHQVINEKPIAPRSMVNNVPTWLSQLTLACLEKNRDNRIHTAGELVYHLTNEQFKTRNNVGNSTGYEITGRFTAEDIKGFPQYSDTFSHVKSGIESSAISFINKVTFLKERVLVGAIVVVILLIGGLVGANILRNDNVNELDLAQQYLEQGDAKLSQEQFELAITFYEKGKALNGDLNFQSRIDMAMEAIDKRDSVRKVKTDFESPGESLTDMRETGEDVIPPETEEDENVRENDDQDADEPETGTLNINVEPGGEIYINGQLAGNNRITEELNDGTYNLRIQKEGYIKEERQVEIIAGLTNTVNFELEPEATIEDDLVLQPSDKKQLNRLGIEMVLVEGDESRMEDFYLSRFEVTQETWQKVMNNNPSMFQGPNRPVENISRQEIQSFLQQLNKITGLEFRLPTEAEWRYAAGGGKSSNGLKYSGSNSIDKVAWYESNASETNAVGTKSANALGIYDMSGNVWEVCSSGYMRGGGWMSPNNNCTISSRSSAPNGKDFTVGIRLCLSAN